MPALVFNSDGQQERIDINGEPLRIDLPEAVEVSKSPEGWELRHAPHARWSPEGHLDEFAGHLVVPYLDRTRPGTIAVGTLRIPPRKPWTFEHIKRLWTDLASAPIKLAVQPVQGSSEWRTVSRQMDDPRLHLDSLAPVIGSARFLLTRWPRFVDRAVVWHPLDRHMGRELGSTTERGFLRHTAVATAPERTARAVSDTKTWRSWVIASLSSTLVTELSRLEATAAQEQTIGTVPPALRTLISEVGARALPTTGAADVGYSSWPGPFRDYYAAAVQALGVISAISGGSTLAPLTEVWRLYEAWIAARVFHSVENLLGDADVWHDGGRRATWTRPGGTVEVSYQLTIGTQPSPIAGTQYRSVTSDLTPDITIAVTTPQGATSLLLVDPKRRPALSASEATVEASKYLWSIREIATNRHPTGVVLVAPRGGEGAAHAEGRIQTIHASPGDPPGRPNSELGDDLDDHLVRGWLNGLGFSGG